MKRIEYIDYCMSRKSMRSNEKNVIASVTDPTQAQSGRDMVFNPKPINYNRVTYTQGVPAADMKSFDRMYPDKFESHREAQQLTSEVIDKVSKLPKEPRQEPIKE